MKIRKIKKLIALLLSLVLAISILPVSVAYAYGNRSYFRGNYFNRANDDFDYEDDYLDYTDDDLDYDDFDYAYDEGEDPTNEDDYFVSLKLDGSICVTIFVNSNYLSGAGDIVTLTYPDEEDITSDTINDYYTDTVEVRDVDYNVLELVGDSVSFAEARVLGVGDLSGYSKLECKIAPAQINETITVSASNDNGDYKVLVEFTVKDVVREYIDEFLHDSNAINSEEIVALCRSILSYGDDAFEYFSTQAGYGFNNENPTQLNSRYYNEPFCYTTEGEEDFDAEFDEAGSCIADYTNETLDLIDGCTIQSFAFTCVSNSNMRYKLLVPESEFVDDKEVKFSLDFSFDSLDEELSEIESEIDRNSKVKYAGKETVEDQESGKSTDYRVYYIRVKGIPAQCLGETYTVDVTRQGEEGPETVYAFSSSAMAYASEVFNNGYEEGTDTEENLFLEKKMMLSVYRYWLAACSFLETYVPEDYIFESETFEDYNFEEDNSEEDDDYNPWEDDSGDDYDDYDNYDSWEDDSDDYDSWEDDYDDYGDYDSWDDDYDDYDDYDSWEDDSGDYDTWEYIVL